MNSMCSLASTNPWQKSDAAKSLASPYRHTENEVQSVDLKENKEKDPIKEQKKRQLLIEP